MKLKALIVDDEYPARQELRHTLNSIGEVEIVGEATNAREALALIKALDYQVLFLDIAIPGMSGLELGAAIQELPKRPYIVFVTAYDEFAVKAFEVNAVDYILKPFEPKRIKKAIEKIFNIISETNLRNGSLDSSTELKERVSDRFQTIQSKLELVPADKQGKTILVPEAEIYYAYTELENVYVKTFDNQLYTRFTLKDLIARLNPNIFFRTHRCYLVNLYQVKEIVPFFNGTYQLKIMDKETSEVPVSRSQAKKLRNLLGL